MLLSKDEMLEEIKTWQVTVKLKQHMRQKKPFGPNLQSNICCGIILSYVGRWGEVCPMLQTLNHQGRAYIIAQEGIPGFLVVREQNIIGYLNELRAKEKLPELISCPSTASGVVGSIWGGITSVFTNDYVTAEIEEMFKQIESITQAVEKEAKKGVDKEAEEEDKTEGLEIDETDQKTDEKIE